MKIIKVLVVFFALATSGCVNTYYDQFDPFAYGRRWHDRGRYDRAAGYWDPLVEKGDCDAEYWVGMLYFSGHAKPKDNERAIALWLKAANGNQPKAQGAMGDLYYQKGIHRCAACSIEPDLVQAYTWYRLFEKSARYDGERAYAKDMLREIRAEMTKEQIARGDERVSEWKPSPKDCGARNWW